MHSFVSGDSDSPPKENAGQSVTINVLSWAVECRSHVAVNIARQPDWYLRQVHWLLVCASTTHGMHGYWRTHVPDEWPGVR